MLLLLRLLLAYIDRVSRRHITRHERPRETNSIWRARAQSGLHNWPDAAAAAAALSGKAVESKMQRTSAREREREGLSEFTDARVIIGFARESRPCSLPLSRSYRYN